MARDSDETGSGKATRWIVLGIVGGFVFLFAGVIVLAILAFIGLGTSVNSPYGIVRTKSTKTEAAKKPLPVGIQIGNQAPEIEGEDIQGAKFKLSDYRGKVVMLDFWGNW